MRVKEVATVQNEERRCPAGWLIDQYEGVCVIDRPTSIPAATATTPSIQTAQAARQDHFESRQPVVFNYTILDDSVLLRGGFEVVLCCFTHRKEASVLPASSAFFTKESSTRRQPANASDDAFVSEEKS
mmetsp:Transcript_3798/g.10679  ORF Transcript_3798/g.10679 Transcript_3798/m.10679 type:complete len:129 (-) Transcript_3798:208-594(-)